MINLYLLLFCLALIIAFCTAYEDMKSGKIKNKLIAGGFLLGGGIYLIGYFISVFEGDYILKIFLNSLIALFWGYLIWYFGGWSAGDAKLFSVLAFLLPFKYYRPNYFPPLSYFPSFSILLNTFLLIIIFLFFKNIFYFKETILDLKNKVKNNWFYYFKIFLNFFLLFFVFQLIQIIFRINSNNIIFKNLGFLAIILLINKFYKKIFLKRWLIPTEIALIVSFLIIDCFFLKLELMENFSSLIKKSILFLIIFGLLNFLLSSFFKKRANKKLPFAVWLLIGLITTVLLKDDFLHFFYKNI